MIPSLLFEQNKTARTANDPALFSDVHLDALFGEQTLEILRIPCDPNEIRMRQRLFARLEDEAFRREFFSLSEALARTHQARVIYQNAHTECERCLSFYTYASRYLAAAKITLSLDFPGNLSETFSDFCVSLSGIKLDLEKALGALDAPIRDILTSRAFLSPLAAFIDADNPSEGLMADLISCAEELELGDLHFPGQRSVDLPGALSEAIYALYPAQFAACAELIANFSGRLDPEFCELRSQITFFQSVFELLKRAEARGIPHAVPLLSEEPIFLCKDAYDVSLLSEDATGVIPNDVDFTSDESFYFLTGANSGGKTTYLRACAINLVLALAGCPVFAKEATVYPFDYLGSHFPRDEVEESGRLFEEQQRVDELFSVGSHPFLFFNETFSGASEQKGLVLTLDCAERCKSRGVFALFVTHYHEVNGHGFSVLSTVVDETDERKRSYKIGKNTGLRSSFAEDILKKYRLDEFSLAQRRRRP